MSFKMHTGIVFKAIFTFITDIATKENLNMSKQDELA